MNTPHMYLYIALGANRQQHAYLPNDTFSKDKLFMKLFLIERGFGQQINRAIY